jgi:hypothetical protein
VQPLQHDLLKCGLIASWTLALLLSACSFQPSTANASSDARNDNHDTANEGAAGASRSERIDNGPNSVAFA